MSKTITFNLVISCVFSSTFVEEDALDRGGVSKELLTLLIQQFSNRGIVRRCGSRGQFLWFYDTKSAVNELSINFILGLIIGLAVHNSILVNFPISPSIYKLFCQEKVLNHFV